MQIQNLRINNFYSFKEAEIDFTKYNGIVKIVGVNKDSSGSNGSGKSTIFEAVVWGLLGKTIRKSSEDALVNFQFPTNCFVSLKIKKSTIGDIEIYRSKRPTSLDLKINGVLCNKANASETQKFIEEILELDYKSFNSAVVFGQHSDISFLESSPEDKRSIIRNCFNLDDLFSKRNAVKEIKSAIVAEGRILSAIKESSVKDIEEVKGKLPQDKYKLVELPPLEEILLAEKKIQENKNKSSEISAEISKLKKESQKLGVIISKGIYFDVAECPICKSEYSTSQTSEQLEKANSDKEVVLSRLEELNASYSDLAKEALLLKPQYSSNEWAKYNEKNMLIKQSQYHIDKYNELNSKLKSLNDKLTELDQRLEVMKFWEKAFSEQGLIKYVIRSILDYFNLKCNEFLSILTNGQFRIEFSDSLVESITNNNLETKYVSLSGGEKRRVNLSIMLALQDLSSRISKINCNLVFFDEVCDNIDELGIEAIYNLLNVLRTQYPDKVQLLITHNNYLNSLLSDVQEIKVIKEKGISKIYGN